MEKKGRILPYSILGLCLLTGVFSLAGGGQLHGKASGINMEERFLKADGKVLRDHAGTGKVVTLRGTNIGGWQVMEAWMCPTNAPDQKKAIATLTERFGRETAEELIKVYESAWIQEQDFDNIKALNFNVLRLPISYLNLLEEDGTLRQDTIDTYDWFVGECEKRGIYVILDLHAAPGSQNGRDHSGDTSGSVLFTDEKAQEQTVFLWEQLAEHYKGNPTIAGYDLLNEPEGNEAERAPWGSLQLPFFDRLYRAVRAVDPDHMIIFNSVWEPSDMPDPSVYGWENVMYEYHYYGWDGTDNPAAQRKFIDDKVKNDGRMGFNVPVLIGEFTLFDRLQSWEYALRTFEEQGWSWTTWTYKTVDCGNWGIYNSTTATTPKVNIYLDPEETIRDKWSRADTAGSFKVNKYLHDLLRTFAGSNTKEASSGTASDTSSGYISGQRTAVWFQNFDFDEAVLRSGTDASSAVVNAKEATHTMRNDTLAVQLTVSEAERMPTATSRNVCIVPAIRDSVDASGLDYLMFDTFVRTGNRTLQVTLADKEGNTWSGFTSAAAMPVALSWEKIFADISKADIDTSAIVEIRIGANVPGEYYFDNIYFASSYAEVPTETEAEMQADPGVPGIITDWEDIPESSVGKASGKPWVKLLVSAVGVLAVLAAGLFGLSLFKRNRKRRP